MLRNYISCPIVFGVVVFGSAAFQPCLQAQGGGAASTPGSCIATHLGSPIPDGRKWYPVQIATSHLNAACPGRNVQMVELRGWIHGFVPPPPPPASPYPAPSTVCNGADPDWHYELELDTPWALSRGINLSQLLRVGDIYIHGYNPRDTGGVREKAVSTPGIELEVFGWQPTDHPQQSPPAGWGFTNADPNSCAGVYWPFNPINPTGKNPLAENQYVRVVGSLMTDETHEHQAGLPTFACGNFGLLCSDIAKDNDIKIAWGNGVNDKAADPMRPTEFHPPDLIESLPDPGHKETLRGIAVLSEHCLVGLCASQTVDEDIAPPAACPNGSRVAYQELVGMAQNETNFATIEEGNRAGPNGTNTGAQITVGANSIHVHVTVRGRSANGAYGRFKALYRVFCFVPPPSLQASACPTVDGRTCARPPLLPKLDARIAASRPTVPITARVTVSFAGKPVAGAAVTVEGKTAITDALGATVVSYHLTVGQADVTTDPRGKPTIQSRTNYMRGQGWIWVAPEAIVSKTGLQSTGVQLPGGDGA